ncbi:hypothetical protein [Oceanicola sp. S124]|uniref:hypothetical protein n=1 Tax=Oceanicola sp. S124 TaxID=1042378 RepID=UPI000493BED6|nr:hypothetical protein [Oceanicola sp. S124]
MSPDVRSETPADPPVPVLRCRWQVDPPPPLLDRPADLVLRRLLDQPGSGPGLYWRGEAPV